jgi:hypothetical protein
VKAGAIQIAAGVVLGSGIIALVGAHLPVATEAPPPHEAAAEASAAAPVPIPPATAGVAPVPAAAPPTGAWRKRAAPPSDVPAGVLVRAASARKQAAPPCAPAEPESSSPARPEARPPVACAPASGGVESVEIDWGVGPARQ